MSRVDGLVFGTSPFAVIEVDSALRVVEWNERAELVFGAARADALGKAVAELVPVDGGEAAWRELVDGVDEPYVRWMTRAGDERVFESRRIARMRRRRGHHHRHPPEHRPDDGRAGRRPA